jgi:hypothetical protein
MNTSQSVTPVGMPIALRADRIAAPAIVAVKAAVWMITIATGSVCALWKPYRFATDDAVSYLDIADAYRLHHWREALNGYWSPLYSWILAAGEWAARPSGHTEITLVRTVNLVLYLAAFAAFHALVRRILHRGLDAGRAAVEPEPTLRLPEWAWPLVAYPLFLGASLKWIGPRTDTPDMLAAALVFVAAGLSVGETRRRTSQPFLVGAVVGLAYLAKTAMFFFAAAFIVANALDARGWRRRAERLCAAAFAFVVVAAPFITALSLQRGRLTIGDAGTLNYVWIVHPTRRVVPDEHWQGGAPEYGTPRHPARRLWNDPPVFEFDGPVRGTYSPWTDPSYWFEGVRSRFDARAQLAAAVANARFYGDMFAKWVALILVAAWLLDGLGRSVAALSEYFVLIVPSTVGLGTYLLATNLHVVDIPTQPSTRFVAPFVVLIVVALLASLRIPDSSRTVLSRVTFLGAAMIWSVLAIAVGTDMQRIAAEQPVPPTVALRLQEFGLRPGDAVAIVGSKYGRDYDHEFWARLARLRIIGQVAGGNRFFSLPPTEQNQIRVLLASAGAKALIYKASRGGEASPEWHHLASGYYVSFLSMGSQPE